MNSRENMDPGTALMLAGLAMAFILLFAFFAIVSFVMTILCLFAWREPLTIGSMTITPEEAKGFIGSGVLCFFGTIAVIIFLGGKVVSPNIVPFLMIAGYTAGSLGYACYIGMQQEREAELRRYAPAQPSQDTRPALPQPTIEDDQPFLFANWNDEEAHK